MKFRLVAVAVGALLTFVASASDETTGISAPDTVVVSFARTSDTFPNPERGWHGGGYRDGFRDLSAAGFTLVRQYVRLDDYRYSDLPALLLDDLAEELAALRQHGLKIILRFSYNFGEDPDAPLSSVLRHIEQLTPVIQDNYDVIAVLQAGFIGAWGEWHSSTNNLLTEENRRTVLQALLQMLPESRMVQVRYPFYASDIVADPVNATTAFSGASASRVGQVNDCFLSNETDGGTYRTNADYDYVEVVSTYTAMGGETCPLGGMNLRNSGVNALTELQRFHYDYLNWTYWRPTMERWEAEGYLDEITQRLGYRYVMTETRVQQLVLAGGTLTVRLTLENEGFGKLYNPRPIEIVLLPVAGGDPLVLTAVDDARKVLPLGGSRAVVDLDVDVPVSAFGEYGVYIRLPDGSPRLAPDSRYSIRFANEGTWQADLGANALGVTVRVR